MKPRAWDLGSAVRIRLEDGTDVAGHVWAESETEGRLWVALESGRYAHVTTATGAAEVCDGLGRTTTIRGKVAA